MPTMNLVRTKTNEYVLHFSRDGKKTLCGVDVFDVIVERFPTDKPSLIQMIDGVHPRAWICRWCERRATKGEGDE